MDRRRRRGQIALDLGDGGEQVRVRVGFPRLVDVADAAIAGIAGARVAGIGGIQCAGDDVVGPAAADGSSGRVGGVGGKTEVGCEQLAVHQ